MVLLYVLEYTLAALIILGGSAFIYRLWRGTPTCKPEEKKE